MLLSEIEHSMSPYVMTAEAAISPYAVLKSWQTLGDPRMIILKGYRTGFEPTPRTHGSHWRVFVDYSIPDGGHGRLPGALFASTSAH
jgi:hypothetical protein